MLDSLLGPGGALEASLDGYEHRPEQLALAHEVGRALEERNYLLAEAGTGTGKTFAYLVPALLSGRTVVVSTATKTLQEQIFHRDLPWLEKALGLSVPAVHLKGRSNYLCLHRWAQFEAEPRFASREEAGAFDTLKAWVSRTQSGDRAELKLPESFSTWAKLSTTSETCLGSRCELYEACFVTRVRREAESARLLVVNHHLFFADLALRARLGRGEAVLPPYDAVIFDEAHALEDVATDYFGVGVSNFRFEELCRDAQEALPVEANGDERAGTLQALAVKVRAQSDELFKRLPPLLGLRKEGAVRLTAHSLRPLDEPFRELGASVRALGAFVHDAREPALASLARRAQELDRELELVTRAASLDHVFWAEARGRGVFLRGAPIEVSQPLRAQLYGALDTAVFTSATLTAAGRFDFFASRMGLLSEGPGDEGPGRRVRTVAVESPFDYRAQAALYVPSHLPDPNGPGFVEAVAEELVALTALTGGRAFALFTSLRNMVQAYQLTRDRLGCQVLVQGERPKSALLEAFRAEPSVLFASHSFWEGVDVPGEALSLVVIDKLPFASPADPLVAARVERLRARGEDAFSSFQVPQAALALRQGFGRLIRSRKDRGIVALLDPRLTHKRYGRTFLESLPPARRMSERTSLERWFTGRGVDG